MLGMIPRHTGLVKFIEGIIQKRENNASKIQEAMEQADAQMYERGIVAVGDHANTAQSAQVKRNSKIHYHTFIEVLGFDPAKADTVWKAAEQIQEAFEDLPTSVTPHAPYSVSKPLFRLIRANASSGENL